MFDDSTPNELEPYFSAEKLRQERKDTEQWYMGAYILDAVYVAVSKCLAGSKSRAKYPDKPFSTQKEEVEQAEALSDADKFGMWVSVFNANRSTQD